METLIFRHKRLLSQVLTDFVRNLMQKINWDNRLIAIRGARGVGKTTLMLQYIKINFGDNQSALYASLDNIYFTRHTITELADNFYKHGGKCLFLDEVNKYAQWSREVKNIYDEYPDLKIVISGSSLLNIVNAEADLSRRCISYDLQGLSYREYLRFFHNIVLPAFSLDEILKNPSKPIAEINKKIRPLKFFDDYLRNGYYPFAKEGNQDYYQRIENVVNMIIEIELPQLCGVDIGNARKIKTMLGILSSEVPFSVDISKLSSLVGVTRNTVTTYLQYLHRAKLIRLLYSDLLSVKRLQKPDKIYMENTNLLYTLALSEVNKGTLREVFIANQLAYEHRLEYSTTSADYLVDGKYTIEVGGKSKGGKQLTDTPNSYIAADDIDFSAGNKIPLWLFGFLY